MFNESENEQSMDLKELFSKLDELNKDSVNVAMAAVETCCDTGLLSIQDVRI
jgi:hypothetical protein